MLGCIECLVAGSHRAHGGCRRPSEVPSFPSFASVPNPGLEQKQTKGTKKGQSGGQSLWIDLGSQSVEELHVLRGDEQVLFDHRRQRVVGLPPIAQRLGQSRLFQHVRHSPEGNPQVALPRGVGRVGLGQPLPDAERLAEQPLGLGQIPRRRRQIVGWTQRGDFTVC